MKTECTTTGLSADSKRVEKPNPQSSVADGMRESVSPPPHTAAAPGREFPPRVGGSMVHALVRTAMNDPCQREWILVQARSLEEGLEAAKNYYGVQQVYEVCWDPGYIT